MWKLCKWNVKPFTNHCDYKKKPWLGDASVICQPKKKNALALVREEHLEDGKIMIENDAFGAIMATINVDNGLNVVMN